MTSLRPRQIIQRQYGGLIVAALLMVACSAVAAAEQAPDGVVVRLSDATMAAIADAGPDDAAAIDPVAGLVQDTFALPALAQFTLGDHWPAASDDERAAYQAAFARHIARTTIRRFRDFEPGALQVLGSRPVGDTDTLLGTLATRRDGSSSRLLWRLRQTDGQWRIIDIVLDGVSLGVTSRDEFAAFLGRHDGQVAALIEALSTDRLGGG